MLGYPVKIELKITPSLSISPLMFAVIHIEGKRFVEHGQTVYLRCNTTEGGRTPEDIDWFKDGDKIEKKLYPKVFITKHRSEETKSLVSELMISSGTSKDTGTYICRSSSHLIASIEVNVLIADSPNVKRGTGTSNTQVGNSQQNDENAAMFLPSFLGNPLILFVTIFSAWVVQHLVT
ncbi:neuroglian [Plakobranchus ocellatus]|uniref:Neuroglian n=1 Tax=Plakobranchus ocellatus TaxID=259542 RepID=A0AAV4CXF5_9GAST|nr:neuroglian [Plakobranchus ocellatus]